ncbi:MAG: hypothetical protein AAB903_00145 [Patescibacteria group bacterium]
MATENGEKKKTFLNAVLSLLEPELRRFGERLATSVTPDSPLRGEGAERVFGVLRSLVESLVERLPGPAAEIGEKVTDIGEYFAAALYGKHGREEGKTAKTAGNKAVKDWMDSFLEEAAKRMAKATDPTEEAKKLEVEFSLRMKLLEMIEEARDPAKKLEALEKELEGVKTAIRDQKRSAQERRAALTERLNRSGTDVLDTSDAGKDRVKRLWGQQVKALKREVAQEKEELLGKKRDLEKKTSRLRSELNVVDKEPDDTKPIDWNAQWEKVKASLGNLDATVAGGINWVTDYLEESKRPGPWSRFCDWLRTPN